jgi:hypothetical protein
MPSVEERDQGPVTVQLVGVDPREQRTTLQCNSCGLSSAGGPKQSADGSPDGFGRETRVERRKK